MFLGCNTASCFAHSMFGMAASEPIWACYLASGKLCCRIENCVIFDLEKAAKIEASVSG